ncbi:hypothetical protein Tco_0536730 [Tanacetum coccineum]
MVGRIFDQVQSFYVSGDLYWTAKLVLWCLLSNCVVMSSNDLYCVLLQRSFLVTFFWLEVRTFEALLGGDNSYPLPHNVVLILLMKSESVSWFPAVTATDAAAAGDAFCCFQSRYSSVCLNGWVTKSTYGGLLLLVMSLEQLTCLLYYITGLIVSGSDAIDECDALQL